MIRYRAGYKYQLAEDYKVFVEVHPPKPVDTAFVLLSPGGLLTIAAGYAWDGPSGPAFDTKNFMRGSLVHDALYQLMGEGVIDTDRWRKVADEELVRICREDGMSWLRAKWVYAGVRFGGTGRYRNPVLTAP